MPVAPHATDDEIAEFIKSGLTASEVMRRMTNSGRYGSNQLHRVKRICAERGLELFREETSRRSIELINSEIKINEYIQSSGRQRFSVDNGVVLIGSDAHYWPGVVSTAHRAFLKFARDMKPCAVVKNGDAFDGSSISRFPRIGWDKRPTVKDELQVTKDRMGEIEEASSTKNLYWPLGNHDARFETFLASHAPEYEGVQGFHLKDHFPLWKPCWAVWINDDVVVKHRFKSGLHAPHNNTLWSGKTMVTGHLHSLKVQPVSDYNGTRYGVDCGTMGVPYGDAFSDYTEDNCVNWRSGFVVLTFHKGKLLWPEVVHVMDEEQGLVQFRGRVIEV